MRWLGSNLCGRLITRCPCITDARILSMQLDEWPVWYWTALEAVAGLRYGALMCADDAKIA